MKNVRLLVCAMSLVWATAHAEVDLRGSVAIAEGQCPIDTMIYKCFIVSKDELLYIVAVDERGALAIYSVKEVKQDYSPEEVKLLWMRNTPLRRKDDT